MDFFTSWGSLRKLYNNGQGHLAEEGSSVRNDPARLLVLGVVFQEDLKSLGVEGIGSWSQKTDLNHQWPETSNLIFLSLVSFSKGSDSCPDLLMMPLLRIWWDDGAIARRYPNIRRFSSRLSGREWMASLCHLFLFVCSYCLKVLWQTKSLPAASPVVTPSEVMENTGPESF